MSEKSYPLFPPYLNRGSVGGAVDTLHVILEAFGFGEGIVPDLQYGETTAARVADMQRWLEVEADGNFGPATRAALKAKTRCDVNAISWAPQDGVTVFNDEHVIPQVWPPNE